MEYIFSSTMEIAKERVAENTFIANWIWYDHQARYKFASQFVKGKKVLDCACGAGFSSQGFLEAGAQELVGVDVSETALQAARTRISSSSATFKKGDATQLPVDDRSIDVYISLETIEHVEETQLYLKEVKRVLKEDGLFICSTPNRTVMNPGKKLSDKPWNRYHVREYNCKEIKETLQEHFSYIEWYGLNRNSLQKIALLEKLGLILPFHLAVRINQLFKLPKIFYDKQAYHKVVPLDDQGEYEFLVAVCSMKEINK